jgi:hypothetical protein
MDVALAEGDALAYTGSDYGRLLMLPSMVGRRGQASPLRGARAS